MTKLVSLLSFCICSVWSSPDVKLSLSCLRESWIEAALGLGREVGLPPSSGIAMVWSNGHSISPSDGPLEESEDTALTLEAISFISSKSCSENSRICKCWLFTVLAVVKCFSFMSPGNGTRRCHGTTNNVSIFWRNAIFGSNLKLFLVSQLWKGVTFIFAL